MTKRIQILAVLLGLQVILAVVLGMRGSGFGAVQADQPLIDFDAAAVDHVILRGGAGETVELAKKDGKWLMPGQYDFPASAPKVQALIDEIHGLRTRMPVSTSKDAFARFKVADDQYERRIAFMQGEQELGVLYLGDSPGYKRLFARGAKSEAVFEIGYSAYQAGTKASDWTEKALFSLTQDQIVGLKINGLALKKKDKAWQIDGDDAELDQDKVTDLVRDAANLNYLEVLGTEAKPEYKQETPVVTLEIQPQEGDAQVFVLSKPDAGEDYVMKAAHQPWYFKVAEWGVKNFKETGRDQLLKHPPIPEKGAEKAPARDASQPSTTEPAAPADVTPVPAAPPPVEAAPAAVTQAAEAAAPTPPTAAPIPVEAPQQ